MRNITFIGNLETTFGARWRRELDPESVERGKYLKRYFKKGQRIDNIDLVNSRLATAQMDAQALKRGMSVEIEKRGDTRSFNGKKSNAQSNGLVAPKDRAYRKESLKLDREIRLGDNTRKNYKPSEWPKNPKVDIKPNVVFETKPPTKSTHVMPTNKIKLGMKGKLGLGAIGLATVGAVGYGIARKLRSDKGKKRGRYFK